jgi:hypothetical protein
MVVTVARDCCHPRTAFRPRDHSPACTSDSIHALDDMPDDKEDKEDFVARNGDFYKN